MASPRRLRDPARDPGPVDLLQHVVVEREGGADRGGVGQHRMVHGHLERHRTGRVPVRGDLDRTPVHPRSGRIGSRERQPQRRRLPCPRRDPGYRQQGVRPPAGEIDGVLLRGLGLHVPHHVDAAAARGKVGPAVGVAQRADRGFKLGLSAAQQHQLHRLLLVSRQVDKQRFRAWRGRKLVHLPAHAGPAVREQLLHRGRSPSSELRARGIGTGRHLSHGDFHRLAPDAVLCGQGNPISLRRNPGAGSHSYSIPVSMARAYPAGTPRSSRTTTSTAARRLSLATTRSRPEARGSRAAFQVEELEAPGFQADVVDQKGAVP